MAKYVVPIIYRGQDNFIVEADSVDAAIVEAERRFNDGDAADELGNEWQQVERICMPEVVEAEEA